jgi:thymidylate synthase (FAD)
MNVELLGHFGDDNMVVNVARASYDKLATMYTEDQNNKLIKYLSSHNHWSPFSHPRLQFRLTCPIYVERQLIKTQAGVEYNSISGRYVDFSDTYTEIDVFRKQSVDSKQGSSDNLNESDNYKARMIQEDIIIVAKEAYKRLIDLGVSKEQARTVLPLSLNTTMIWTGSLYSLIRLCKQRIKPEAQKETRDLVQLMLDEVLNIEGNPFKESLSAYGYTRE